MNRAWQPMPGFLPGEFHGQRSLGSYSPWGCKELDATEWLNSQHSTAYICMTEQLCYTPETLSIYCIPIKIFLEYTNWQWLSNLSKVYFSVVFSLRITWIAIWLEARGQENPANATFLCVCTYMCVCRFRRIYISIKNKPKPLPP